MMDDFIFYDDDEIATTSLKVVIIMWDVCWVYGWVIIGVCLTTYDGEFCYHQLRVVSGDYYDEFTYRATLFQVA